MALYNGKFRQCLEIIIKAEDHKTCLDISKVFKKQCDAWAFNVHYTEHTSARKGPVLSRDIMIYQTAHAGDILIFKEAVRRIYQHYCYFYSDFEVSFRERGTEPVNDLRNQVDRK